MVFRIKRKPVRYWFAWRPVPIKCGGWAWLEVVEVIRGYQIGDTKERRGGPWTQYVLANK